MDFLAWARQEFGGVELGDARRAVALGAALASGAGKTLPGCCGRWSDLVAAYRFLSHESATMEAVTKPHRERVRRELRAGQGEFLLVEDTTQVDFTGHPSAKGLGRIGNDGGRGAHLHCALALRVAGGGGLDLETQPLGLADIHSWVREGEAKHRRETRAQRNSRARESQRWGQWLAEAGGPRPGARWIYVADRESDIYELLAERIPPSHDFVVRANQARATQGGRTVFEAAGAGAVHGTLDVQVPSRGGRPARRAVLELRSAGVRLPAPARVPRERRGVLEINVVEAREASPPEGAEALCWVLLTSLPAGSASMSWASTASAGRSRTCTSA